MVGVAPWVRSGVCFSSSTMPVTSPPAPPWHGCAFILTLHRRSRKPREAKKGTQDHTEQVDQIELKAAWMKGLCPHGFTVLSLEMTMWLQASKGPVAGWTSLDETAPKLVLWLTKPARSVNRFSIAGA